MERPYPRQTEAKVALLRRGLEVQEAARRLGYNQSYLSACLNGLSRMTEPMAEQLGTLLDLHPEELLHPERVEATSA